RVQPSRVDGEPLTLFASCLADRAWPDAAVALERIATAAGFKVGFPKAQWCCGLVAANAGDFKSGAAMHEQLAASLGDSQGLIVTPSASCFGAFTIDAPDWGASADSTLQSRIRDSTRFVLQLLESRAPPANPRGVGLKIAYHGSCQALRQHGLKGEPRGVRGSACYPLGHRAASAILGQSRARMEASFDDIVEFSGLGEFIESPLKNYSSGMHARLAFAVAINVDPEVLLIDEVLAVGDEQFQTRCYDRLLEFRRAG